MTGRIGGGMHTSLMAAFKQLVPHNHMSLWKTGIADVPLNRSKQLSKCRLDFYNQGPRELPNRPQIALHVEAIIQAWLYASASLLYLLVLMDWAIEICPISRKSASINVGS